MLFRRILCTCCISCLMASATAQDLRDMLGGLGEMLGDQLTQLTKPKMSQVHQHGLMVGAGWGNVMDTYLSPYSYKGTNLRVVRETQRNIQRFFVGNTEVKFQTLLDVDGSILENPIGNVDGYAGGVRYSASWQYPLNSDKRHTPSFFRQLFGTTPHDSPTLLLYAGPMLSGYVGGVYNDRNGNNPAQAKMDLSLDATASAFFHFNIQELPCTLRYQVALPLMGLAFSPNYGQSYYEIFSLGNSDHNVVFTNVVNAPSMRHLLTLDVPLAKRATAPTLRIGYAGVFMQSDYNNLRYHSYAHTILFGFTKSFRSL